MRYIVIYKTTNKKSPFVLLCSKISPGYKCNERGGGKGLHRREGCYFFGWRDRTDFPLSNKISITMFYSITYLNRTLCLLDIQHTNPPPSFPRFLVLRKVQNERNEMNNAYICSINKCCWKINNDKYNYNYYIYSYISHNNFECELNQSAESPRVGGHRRSLETSG